MNNQDKRRELAEKVLGAVFAYNMGESLCLPAVMTDCQELAQAVIAEDAPPKLSGTHFTCPQCGGRTWGTYGAEKDFAEWVGQCHTPGCQFTWPRFEDAKYFTED